MSFRTRDRSTTRYYGNHDPYVRPKPRTQQWRAIGALLLGPVMLGGAGLFAGNLLVNEEARSAIQDFDIQNYELPWSSEDIETIEYTPRPPIEPGVLAVGDSFDVPCDDGVGTCMRIILGDLDPNLYCSETSERAVALRFVISIAADAPSDFQNPFQHPHWIAVTEGQTASRTEPIPECGNKIADYQDLRFSTPNTVWTGILLLPVPEDTAGIHLASLGETLFSIPLNAS